jgi:hypothetical protein
MKKTLIKNAAIISCLIGVFGVATAMEESMQIPEGNFFCPN